MRKISIAVLAAVGMLALFVQPGLAGSPTGPSTDMVVDPAEGFPGEPFDVYNTEGSHCFGPVTVSVEGDAPLGGTEVPLDPDGDWTTTIDVPTDAVPGDYVVNAHCGSYALQGSQQENFDYQSGLYTVLGDPEPEPEPEPEPDPGVQPAPPAEPEVEAAAFTG